MMHQEIDSGETICYRKYEAISKNQNAKTILLIHGNFCGQRNWDPFIQYLSEFNVYTIDLRGFGKSTYNKPLESLTDFAKDVISFCEKQKLKQIQIVGWSLGGAVGMNVAILSPSLVESLILMASVNLQGFTFMTKAGRERDVEKLKKRLSKLGDILSDSKNKEFIYENIIENRILPLKNHCGEGFLEVIFEQIFSQKNYIDATAYLGIWDISDTCHQIQCPILIFHGTQDEVIPYENAVFNYETFKKYNKSTFLYKFEGGTHAPVYEIPQLMSQVYTEFIKTHQVAQMASKL